MLLFRFAIVALLLAAGSASSAAATATITASTARGRVNPAEPPATESSSGTPKPR